MADLTKASGNLALLALMLLVCLGVWMEYMKMPTGQTVTIQSLSALFMFINIDKDARKT